MSNTGSILSTAGRLQMVLIALAPGHVPGAAPDAWKNPGPRLKGATISGLTGLVLAFAGCWIYPAMIK